MKNILEFQTMKQNKQPIAVVTCYDFTSACLAAQSDVDCLLVGDSCAMVMHGHSTTLPATVTLMELHVASVAKGALDKVIIADLPFLTHRFDLNHTMQTITCLMQAGATAIKLEGADTHTLNLIKHLHGSGIPVMGHIGLTPQAIHQLGGWRIQGRENTTAKQLIAQALALQEAGCFAIVLECIPMQLAADITEQLKIPTIGIGAGPSTDGQVLIWHDLLGLNENFKPKYLKTFLNGAELFKTALNDYAHAVKNGQFPQTEHGYEA